MSFSNFRAKASIRGKLRHLRQHFFSFLFFEEEIKTQQNTQEGICCGYKIAKTLPVVLFGQEPEFLIQYWENCDRCYFRRFSLQILKTLYYYYYRCLDHNSLLSSGKCVLSKQLRLYSKTSFSQKPNNSFVSR